MKRIYAILVNMAVAVVAVLLASIAAYTCQGCLDLGPYDSPRAVFMEKMVACMPTVVRPKGLDYLTYSVRSFRRATRDSRYIRRLWVFVMDPAPEKNAAARRLMAASNGTAKDWLRVVYREEGPRKPPKRFLHGDPDYRVNWRSKEAQDYSETLRRCIQHAPDATYYIILQDDVSIEDNFRTVVEWADTMYRRNQKRLCVMSLHEPKGTKYDGREERVANMVSKIFRKDAALEFIKYVEDDEMFDHSPIDWLVQYFCKDRKQKIVVRYPQSVNHIGAVSSLAQNKRRPGVIDAVTR